jgi:hypothetical protein
MNIEDIDMEKLEALIGNAMVNYKAATSHPDMGKTTTDKFFELRKHWAKELVKFLETGKL